LGCAGEIGHVPVVENGRPCGCGKIGCLECYAAGKGLDWSARELLGEGADAHRLFDEAKAGNCEAANIIANAAVMLGRELVSIVNLISPDRMLFSGGLSRQQELYVQPIIDYVQSHCYQAGGDRNLVIAPSALGADSAMVGAGLFRR